MIVSLLVPLVHLKLNIEDCNLLPNLYELILLGEYIDQDSEDKLAELSHHLSTERFHVIRKTVLESSPGRTADVVIPLDQNFIGTRLSIIAKFKYSQRLIFRMHVWYGNPMQ